MIINFCIYVKKEKETEYNFSSAMIYVLGVFCSDTTARLFIKKKKRKINEGACTTTKSSKIMCKWRKY